MQLHGLEAALFYVLAIMTLFMAVFVVTARVAVHSALFLISTLVNVALLFILLHAEFVAGVQIILYVGGIMVLFLFVIMLVNIEHNLREEQFNKQWLVATIATVVLAGLFGYVYWHGKGFFPPAVAPAPEQVNTQQIGMSLYTAYMFPFEIASVLLLVAIIGAVVMAKKRI